MIIGINQPYYLPYIGLFERMKACDLFIINSYASLNRARANHRRVKIIQTHPEAKLDYIYLTQNIPPSCDGELFSDVKLNRAFWETQRGHIKTIYSMYRSSRGYDYMEGLLEAMEDNRGVFNLGQYNYKLIYFLAKKLGLGEKCVDITMSIQKDDKLLNENFLSIYKNKATHLNLNICRNYGATEHLAGQNGPLWLDEKSFLENNIAVRYQLVNFVPYPQFSRKNYFIQGLSVIDLLFNCGAKSSEILGRGSRFVDRVTLLKAKNLTGR